MKEDGRNPLRLPATLAPDADLVDGRFKLAARLAVLAGGIARSHRREPSDVGWKPDGSMVTAADVEIEQRLAREIATCFPDDAVLGEEEGLRGGHTLAARHWWVLDPIDGTNNFGRGLPGFSISVGVLRDGRPLAGAVYDPTANWLFTGAVDTGAWLNGRRLRVTPLLPTSGSLVSVRVSRRQSLPPAVRTWLARYHLRRFGSTALELCYAAAGSLAFVHNDDVSLWDVAGAAPIVLEAGAVITRSDGTSLFPVVREDVMAPVSLLAGDPLAHRMALDELVPETGVAVSRRE